MLLFLLEAEVITRSCMEILHKWWQWDIFLHFTQSTWNVYLFKKSSESSKGSRWFTVVSFFPLSFTESKAGTHWVEMDSLVPKQRMWNFGATWGGIFVWVSVQETKQNTNYRCKAFTVLENFEQEGSGKKGHMVFWCANIPVLLHITW